ncbi:Protein abhd12b [Mortierella alpina]|nr:Protein abhd12b [Mortierella alpina]
MILNLLATALVLCILGVLFLLIAYVTSLAILLFVPWTQAYLVFAHWLRLQNPARLRTPEAYTLQPFTTRNIRISTSDGLRLGAWHILPKDTPKATLERIYALEPVSPRPRRSSNSSSSSSSSGSTELIMDERIEAIFEEALNTAQKVVLYFHGQVGDRGKSNRIATYKGIQEAMPSAHVITIDCRGYGDSDGFPSELGFKIDAYAAWVWVTQRVTREKVIIYGHSLGSGIATNLCLELEEQQLAPLALVLDAAFTSMPDMMTAYRKIPIVRPFARFPFLLNHFKTRLMDRFETVRAVETIKSPLLLIHGQEDADVLISNSHTLFHTALTARRLKSCTKELAVTEAGEAASAEDELARAGLDLSFQISHSTSRETSSVDNQVLSRSAKNRLEQGVNDQELDSLKEPASTMTPDSQGKPAIGSAASPKAKNDHGHGQCHTVQLDFPREGALEYNQEYQIGFLTVEYAVHNTCMDFEIAKEVLGAFLRASEHQNAASSNIGSHRTNADAVEQDLAKVLCRDKIGYVDLGEVPEVVE